MYATDFDDIFLLHLNNESHIAKSLSAENFSMMREYGVRDSWIFNRLIQLLKENIMQVAKQHCLDAKITQTHWMRLINDNKS